MKITFTPKPIIAEQLQELSRITLRPIGELINDLLDSPLEQIIEQQDTDYMRLVLDGVVYPNHSQAEAVAENYNELNWEAVMEQGQFHVQNAWAGDDNMVHFSKTKLVKASDFESAGK